MMVIVAILGETGVFYWVGIKAINLSKENLWKLMLLLSTFTAIASMFIDNVTTILKVPPIPFILSQALASNIGGSATLIGDPPNILIGSAAVIDFNSFLDLHGTNCGYSIRSIIVLTKVLFPKRSTHKRTLTSH